jgi:hypothetical protein
MMSSSSEMRVMKSRKIERLNITDPSLRIIVTKRSGWSGFFPFYLTHLDSSKLLTIALSNSWLNLLVTKTWWRGLRFGSGCWITTALTNNSNPESWMTKRWESHLADFLLPRSTSWIPNEDSWSSSSLTMILSSPYDLVVLESWWDIYWEPNRSWLKCY